MSRTDTDPSALLAELVGQVCQGVDNPYGSILRLDIGPLGLRVDDDPGMKAHGWRHLTVESPWRLSSEREVICDWNDDGGSKGVITDRIAIVAGKIVVGVETRAPAWDLRLTLSEGLELFIFSDSDDDRDDAWFILGTDGLTLCAGPNRGGQTGLHVKK